MKRLSILMFISVTAFCVLNGQSAKIGGGFGFSSGFPFGNLPDSYNKSGNINATLKGVFKNKQAISFSPSFTFFMPNVSKLAQTLEERKITVNAMMFDFNGHYAFSFSDRFELYGLAGFDILLAYKKEVIKYSDDPITHKISTYSTKLNDNGLGLNIGAGAFIKIAEKIDLYAEAKYLLFTKYKLIFSKYNQVMVNAGILVKMNVLKKNQNTGN
jgi:hypothetical protein